MLNGFLGVYSLVYLALLGYAFYVKVFPVLVYLTFIEVTFVLLASVIWFKEIFTDKSIESLWDSPSFYFISCFVLFFSGSLVYLLMSDMAAFTTAHRIKYLIILIMLTFLQNILLLIGIWKGQHKLNRYSG
jgi:hypothetical protein